MLFCFGMQNFPKAVALCDAAENGHVDCIEILHSLGVSLDEQKVILGFAYDFPMSFEGLC